jgi:hypothetical protein
MEAFLNVVKSIPVEILVWIISGVAASVMFLVSRILENKIYGLTYGDLLFSVALLFFGYIGLFIMVLVSFVWVIGFLDDSKLLTKPIFKRR